MFFIQNRCFCITRSLHSGAATLIILLHLSTSAAGAGNRDINLVYDISWGAVQLAEARSEWQVQDDKAVILGTVKSDGLAKRLLEFHSASSAELDLIDGEWKPVFLSLSRVTKSKQVASSVHWSGTGNILSDVQFPPLDLNEVFPISDPLKHRVIDPYSALMRQLEHIADFGRCSGSYEVYDGLRRFSIKFDTIGTTSLEADRPYSFTGHALQCTVAVTPKGGHRIASEWHKKPVEERQANVFFGYFSGGLILPVRIEINARIGTGIARLDTIQSQIHGESMRQHFLAD